MSLPPRTSNKLIAQISQPVPPPQVDPTLIWAVERIGAPIILLLGAVALIQRMIAANHAERKEDRAADRAEQEENRKQLFAIVNQTIARGSANQQIAFDNLEIAIKAATIMAENTTETRKTCARIFQEIKGINQAIAKNREDKES
jgi:hypothetical protein